MFTGTSSHAPPAGLWEPYDGRLSRTVLREREGEAPSRHSPNQELRGADAVSMSGRQHRQQRYRKLWADPARSENQGMYGTSVRENREVPHSPVCLIIGRAAQGRLRPQA